jgi:hypothetical protein
MDSEKEIASRVEQYRELAKEDKKIDAVALMTSALVQSGEEAVAAKNKRWAYLVSVGLPPLGLLPAVYYYFSGKADGKRVALTCVILTVLAAAVAWFVGSLAMSGLSSSGGQLQDVNLNVNLRDLHNLLQ